LISLKQSFSVHFDRLRKSICQRAQMKRVSRNSTSGVFTFDKGSLGLVASLIVCGTGAAIIVI
jgi:hypothetical protein